MIIDYNYPPIVQVNGTGKVIGPIRYEVAHARTGNPFGVRHLSANIFVFEDNSTKKILITRRAGKIDGAGKLNVCIGGHAEWLSQYNRAQTPLETVLAELQEEIFYQIELPPNIKLEEVSNFNKDLRKTDPEYVFLFKTICRGPFRVNPFEVSAYFFEEIELIKKDIQINPNNYVKSAGLYLEKLLTNSPELNHQ